jgi:hypothetical protein
VFIGFVEEAVAMLDDGILFQPERQAPEFTSGVWLNSEQRQIRMGDLRGRVVLLDLWDYTSINCLRTLPYVREWQRRYADYGLTVIGIHTPEFAFGREQTQVELAVTELGVSYPVFLDNNFDVWNAYDNQFWPAKYLIDAHGFIRARHYGEGNYAAFERALQTLLRERDSRVDLPPVMTPLRPEDAPDANCYRPTPSLRGGLKRGALGNPEGYAGGAPLLYRLPGQRMAGAFYVSGAWQADEQCLAYLGSSEGIVQVPYEAAEVHAVLSPHVDTVERMVNPRTITVEIWQDDQPLHDDRRGADLTDDGRVLVNRPRTYNLIRNPGFERHELTLRVKANGFALYGFAFVSSVRG